MNAMVGKQMIRINNGPTFPGTLSVKRDAVMVSFLGPKPDTRWSTVDEAGHFHAYNGNGEDRYPTLRQMEYVCPSSHEDEGWWCECRTDWECRICKAPVVPGMKAGPHQDAYPGPTSWEVFLDVETPTIPTWVMNAPGKLVTVENGTHFGIAEIASVSLQMFGDLVNVKAVFIGTGVLGERGKE